MTDSQLLLDAIARVREEIKGMRNYVEIYRRYPAPLNPNIHLDTIAGTADNLEFALSTPKATIQ